MAKKIIKDGHIVIYDGGQVSVLENYSILINDNLIEKIDKYENLRSEATEIIDAKDKIVIPGLINTHHHLSQSLTRGMKSVQNLGLFDWLTKLYEVWKNLSYESLYVSSLVSLTEMLKYGCTTSTDMCYLFPQNSDAKLEAVIQAAQELGIRFHAGRGSMSVGISNGGLPPDVNTQAESEIVRDSLRIIDKFHDPDPMAMLKIDLSPCAPFSISKDLMMETRKIAKDKKLLCHTHLAETLDEEVYCLEKYGSRPAKFLQDLDWLGDDVYLAHCVHLNKEEIQLFADTGTGVAHCPSSNMRLGSGIAPIVELMGVNAKVGLGVDGSSSNDSGNILNEARMALFLQRVKHGASCMNVGDAIKLGTIGGARLLNRTDKLGSIELGKAADFAIYDLNTLEHAGAYAQDPLGALLLCNANKADTVIVNGKVVVSDGNPVNVDTEKITHRLNEIVRSKFLPVPEVK
ncbi:MAG: 8-oxoguanine deaminase [Candidatus Sericytochromatia bacterium]|nr:8-oxoguanine deaminase [Candidatus Sericytochromatia bacterium]